VKPTRVPVLLLVLLVAVAFGYVMSETSYSRLPPLPSPAPVTLGLLALVEGWMAFVVRGKVRGRRPGGRPMHALQVARAAVLAKASSLGGAVVGGVYGGIFVWTFNRRGDVATYAKDARISGLAAAAGVLLIVAALLLERACRTPKPPADEAEH
jgi:NhaP-type Na+/H+ or K+/H+ antiporter